ncbi:MAG: response regulator [Acidobacteriia bacterium]|nr:response regulator [Terriglobia bacterium]
MQRSILIIDDNDAVRASLRSWIATTFPSVSCVEASSGEEALSLVRESAPDLALMDIGLPGINGIEATQRLKEIAPDTKVIIVSIHDADSYRAAAEAAGASGYVSKQHMVTELSALLPRFLGHQVPEDPAPSDQASGPGESGSRAYDRASPGPVRVVVVSDMPARTELVASLTSPGTAEWRTVADEEALIAELAVGADIILVWQESGSLTPERALEVIRRERNDILTVVVGRCDDEEAVMRYIELGAIDCLSRRRLPRINAILSQAAERRRLAVERRRAAAALEASEARYRLIATNTSDGIFTLDQEGRVTFVTPRWLQEGGYEEAGVLGRHMADFVAPEHRSVAWETFTRSLVGEKTPLCEIELLAADGARRSVELGISSLIGEGGRVTGQIGVFRDVTERKRAEEDRRRLAAAIEQAAETVVITDTDGRIQFVNPAFEVLTGYSRAEVLGKNPRILKSGQHPPELYRELWDTLLSGRTWKGHLINRRKDGTLFEEDAVISPVRDAVGTIVNFAAVKRDVTQEVALEAQLRQSQKMEVVGELVGGVAHDFNNLLQAMLSHTQLLRSQSTDPEGVLAVAQELEKHVNRGAWLTRQLLLFSRRETARLERLDLNDVVRNTTQMLRRLVRSNIELAIELASGSMPVEADHGQLEQVLMNLAVNASDAMPDGGKLVIRTGNFSHGQVWMTVEDTGQGIPEAIRARIFEPFFTTKRAGKGTGLGLAVVQSIVALHNGKIEVESKLGQGTVFKVILSRAPSSELRSAEVVQPLTAQLEPGRGERILVVEDEDAARDGLQRFLVELGYEAVAVSRAEEAMALLDDRPFDALLTDLMLPAMGGGELAKKLQEHWPNLKVLLMSGYTEDEAVSQVDGTVYACFLQKPFNMATLAKEVRTALGRGPDPGFQRGDGDK